MFGPAGFNATSPTPTDASSHPATTAFAGTGNATARHRPTAVRAATAETWKCRTALSTDSGQRGLSGARVRNRATSE